MRSWVLAACLFAAAAPPALAADLGDGRPYAYDDNDDDGDDGYRERSGRRHSRGDAHSDDDGDDAREKHARAHRRYGRTCTRSEDIRNRLIRHGWRDFHGPHPGAAEVVTLRARRPNGRLFELTLERCSGRLAYARPLERRPLRSFAPGEFPPGRWDRYESDDPWFRRPYASRWHRDRED